jgi:AGZA family xanthine/uracil permease-like MFS transporter
MATTKAAPSSAGTAIQGYFKDALNPTRRGSTHRTEFLAGLTTFVTMAYIIFVNTDIMAAAGLDKTALIIGTIFAAVVPTLFMGLWADLPWALAPGLGYNALFAYTVVLEHHIPVGAALALVFLDGLAFLLLVSGPWRESIVKGIPLALKLAAGAGIGLFIAFIGMVNAGIVKLGAFTDVKNGSLINLGGNTALPQLSPLNDPVVIVALIGLIITGVLLAYRVRGGILLGIIATAVVAWIAGAINAGWGKALGVTGPNGLGGIVALPDMGRFFQYGVGRIDFGALFGGAHGIVAGAVVLFFLTFLVTDMMDSFGTFSGLAAKLGILDREGNFRGSGRALMVDAAAGMWGPLTGNATVATFIESAAGEAEGGKTGLTAVWVAVFFLLALFFVPLIGLVPAVATAPALIVVGFYMAAGLREIDFTSFEEGLPALLTLTVMPLTYSITNGIGAGFVLYVFIKLVLGKAHAVSWLLYVVSAAFLLYFSLGFLRATFGI